jgi:hypothetical protein
VYACTYLDDALVGRPSRVSVAHSNRYVHSHDRPCFGGVHEVTVHHGLDVGLVAADIPPRGRPRALVGDEVERDRV